MTSKVLILGGQGRIGSSIANDIATYTQSEVTITGRSTTNSNSDRSYPYVCLDLADIGKMRSLISSSDLVIHCAGPFHHRDTNVLEICIQEGVNYLDVSDHRSYTIKALKFSEKAQENRVSAIVNTGIFPGISNSMVRQCVEQLDEAETIKLSYVVSGSGGAGVTVMRTTFLGLQNPFEAWIDGKWQQVEPYTARESINFPKPYEKSAVYWYDMPETFTLPHAFPTVKNAITKFGSVPDFYNHLTWIAAHIFPKSWIQNPSGIEFLSQVSHIMTDFTDKISGISVAVKSEVTGKKDGKQEHYCLDLIHENTAVAAGCGTGSIAQLILEGRLIKPGVHPVEEALPTDLFLETMESRNINFYKNWS
ncbi:MAG: saccharopine dehydrogenase NADP-binding domain-containing protein [Cyanobacteria bacterium P01_A01_bin.45]